MMDKKYSIPWRKKLAKQYMIKEQYILDMTKNQINAFELGVAAGIAKQTDEIKANYILLDKADEAIYRDFVAEKKREAKNAETNEERDGNVSEEAGDNTEAIHQDTEELE